MDWSRIIDTLVKYIGVAGFVLSLFLAVREAIKSRIRLKVKEGSYFAFSRSSGEEVKDIVLGLWITINNLSSRPVTINRILLIDDDEEKHPCKINDSIIIGQNSSKPDGVQLRSNPLPQNIGGHQGCRVLLQFLLPPKSVQSLRLRDVMPFLAVAETPAEPWHKGEVGTLRLEVQTDRKPVTSSVRVVSVYAPNIWQEMLTKVSER